MSRVGNDLVNAGPVPGSRAPSQVRYVTVGIVLWC